MQEKKHCRNNKERKVLLGTTWTQPEDSEFIWSILLLLMCLFPGSFHLWMRRRLLKTYYFHKHLFIYLFNWAMRGHAANNDLWCICSQWEKKSVVVLTSSLGQNNTPGDLRGKGERDSGMRKSRIERKKTGICPCKKGKNIFRQTKM